MPAGAIGSCWASGSWLDTAWEADSWAGAVAPRAVAAGRARPTVVPPRRLPPLFECDVDAVLPVLVLSAQLSIDFLSFAVDARMVLEPLNARVDLSPMLQPFEAALNVLELSPLQAFGRVQFGAKSPRNRES